MAFDTYALRFGKISAAASGLGALLALLFPCGALFSALILIPQALLLIVALGLPLLWRWLKKRPLAPDAKRWAWIALAALIASVSLMALFDLGGGCWR